MSDETSKARVALITGANKGIGLEVARQLATRGATVLVGARDLDRGEKAADSLTADGLDARFLHIDEDGPVPCCGDGLEHHWAAVERYRDS